MGDEVLEECGHHLRGGVKVPHAALGEELLLPVQQAEHHHAVHGPVLDPLYGNEDLGVPDGDAAVGPCLRGAHHFGEGLGHHEVGHLLEDGAVDGLAVGRVEEGEVGV